MNAVREGIEAVLAEAYGEEVAIYTEVLASVRQRPTMDATAQGEQGWLSAMSEGLDRIARVEGRIADAKAVWKSMNAKPGPQLSDRLVRVAELIRQITAEIGEAEGEAEAKRRRLMPETDLMARTHRMHRAYGARS